MATPTLIQRGSNPDTQGNTVTALSFTLDNPTLAGNMVCFAMMCAAGGGGTITTTNDKGDTPTLIKSVANANQTLNCYAVLATTGSQKYTVNFTVAVSFACLFGIQEWNNIPSITPDGTASGATGNSTTPTAGSITTTQAGDLVLQWAEEDGATNTETWTAGTSFTLSTAISISIPTASQHQIQVSAGAINPSITMGTGDSWATVAVAFKAGSSGTALPAGIRVLGHQFWNLQAGNNGPFTLQFPTFGNLLVIGTMSSPGFDISAVSDGTNTYTQRGSALGSGSSGDVQTWDTDGHAYTPASTLSLTVTFTGSATGGSAMFFLDVKGSKAPNAFDQRTTATGSQAVSGNLSSVSISPAVANGLVVVQEANNSNNITGMSPGIAIMGIPTPFTSTNDPIAENDGAGIEYNANTSSRTYVWTTSGGALLAWAASAVAYKPLGALVFEDDSYRLGTVPLIDPNVSLWQ